ncbi:MAG TPA: lysophospholipid acyltransferase family protein [Solirubrobacteraceae bacterium]|jgi:1-acyl-sn-glycerol-3-phosphate acyltransferase|nr:lysophospholipid acyltransferase family protein [Solirubrobacteraceae bacterium]
MQQRDVQMRPQVYREERPPELFARYYAWARTHHSDWVYTLARLLLSPFCMLAFRARGRDVAHVPGRGAVILAPNHFSAMDHFFCGLYLRRRVRFMAKSQLFRGALAWILRHGGAFPVQRGRRDEQAIGTALEILAQGGAVVIYPEGGRARDGRIAEHARAGVGRLALESGAPVVPVAIHGSEHARNWKRLQFPRVDVRYGEPLRFERLAGSSHEIQQAVADEVLGAVRELYARLARPIPERRRLAAEPHRQR